MKALFCHDHYYYHKEGDILSKGQYHAGLWSRYLRYFNRLTIIGRDGGMIKTIENGMNQCCAPHVGFKLFPNTNSVKGLVSGRNAIKHEVFKLVADHDIIILRGISELGIMAFHAAKEQKHRKKYIVMEVVSCAWDELWYHGSWKAKLYALYRFWKQRQLAKQADAVFYVSQKFLQQRYPSKAPIIACASDVQLSLDHFYQPSAPLPTPYRIGMIGTLKNKLKGVDVAIDAMRYLKDLGVHNASLHILGPGDTAPYQQKIDKMGLTGYVCLDGIRESGKPVFEWLRHLHLYIQPSFQEGLPRAVVEAMSQSLPVIGSDAGGLPELIERDWIVPRGNARALAKKIAVMLHDRDIRNQQAHRNYDVAKDYTAEKLDPVRDDFWKNVIKKVSRR